MRPAAYCQCGRGEHLSAAWIIAGLVAIAALYALLFATAHALHVAEQDREANS